MKKCPKCGKTYDDTWKICLHCSVALSDNLLVAETNPELRTKRAEMGSNMYYILGVIFLYLGSATMFTATFVQGWIIALAMGLPLIAVGFFFVTKGDKTCKDKKK